MGEASDAYGAVMGPIAFRSWLGLTDAFGGEREMHVKYWITTCIYCSVVG